MTVHVSFDAELWEHPGQGRWHFLTLPLPLGEDLRDRAGHRAAGFGSLRVQAKTGSTTWVTSIFPESAGSYVLPVKKQVRKAEDLMPGDVVSVVLDLLDS